MSEITNTIEEILGVRKYDGTNGTIFYFKLRMSDGSTGEIGKKSENALKVGDSLTYTSQETEYGLKFKAVMAGNGFSGGNGAPRSFGGGSGAPRGGNASFCLSYAKDICVAGIPLYPEKTPTDWTTTTLAIADKLLAWMKANQD